MTTNSAKKERRAPYDVLHLIGSNLVGGPEKQILHHAQDMKDSEYRLTIGSFHDLSERPEVLVAAEQRNIPTVCLPVAFASTWYLNCRASCPREKARFSVPTASRQMSSAIWLRDTTNIAHVPLVRGFTAENSASFSMKCSKRQALKRAQRVVCVSEKQAVQIAALRGNRRPPIVVKNAMLPPYAPTAGGRTSFQKRALASPTTCLYLWIGRPLESGKRSPFHDLRLPPSQ